MKRDRFVVAALFATAGILQAQAPPIGPAASEALIERSEAALDAYAAEDWARLRGYFAADVQQDQPIEVFGPAIERQTQVLGRPVRFLLFEEELESDGCALRRYAVRFEVDVGRLELRLCPRDRDPNARDPEADEWDLHELSVTPEVVFLAEYVLTDLVPQQIGVDMMFAHCGADGVPDGVGEMSCIGVTTAGETLGFQMNVLGPGQVEIADARLAAAASPDPTRDILEPMAREFLERYQSRAATEIRDNATPGFQESVDLELLEQVLDELHGALGGVRIATWISPQTDSQDGLPIVRLTVEFENVEAEMRIRVAPFNGGWAVHRFKVVTPAGSAADRELTSRVLLRLARQLTLDSGATLDCPIEKLDRSGSTATCKVTSRGRTIEAQAGRTEERTFMGDGEITLEFNDLQIGLGLWLTELERPLGWKVRKLVCDGPALLPGGTTSCIARHDHGSTRLQVRASPRGRVRIVGAQALQ